jgi:MauM/NapG family ferredoxin protein
MSIIKWISNFFDPPTKESRMDIGRRNLIAAGVAGLGSGLLFKSNPLSDGKNFQHGLIRPPGALDEDAFLGKCIRCGECMKVCPTNVIQFTMLEAGLEGLWSPVLKTKERYCEYTCVMCSEVCPTGAIRKMTLPEKQVTRIGLAHVDKGRCLPYAYSRPCVICQEHCPLPEKAIWLEKATVARPDGKQVTVRYPHVNPELCIGCGVCQNKCPVAGEAAIRVTSDGETRNIKSRFLQIDQYGG